MNQKLSLLYSIIFTMGASTCMEKELKCREKTIMDKDLSLANIERSVRTIYKQMTRSHGESHTRELRKARGENREHFLMQKHTQQSMCKFLNAENPRGEYLISLAKNCQLKEARLKDIKKFIESIPARDSTTS